MKQVFSLRHIYMVTPKECWAAVSPLYTSLLQFSEKTATTVVTVWSPPTHSPDSHNKDPTHSHQTPLVTS